MANTSQGSSQGSGTGWLIGGGVLAAVNFYCVNFDAETSLLKLWF